MKNNPDAFLDRNIFVWIYEHEGLADWAESAKSAAQDERKNSSIDCWQDVGKTLPEGSIVIDFDLQEKKIIIDDVYAVLTDNPFIKTKNGDILLCQPVKNVLDLPLGSKIRWKQAAMRAVKAEPHRNEWHVEQFHQYLWAEA